MTSQPGVRLVLVVLGALSGGLRIARIGKTTRNSTRCALTAEATVWCSGTRPMWAESTCIVSGALFF
jgi:hypothetical protein